MCLHTGNRQIKQSTTADNLAPNTVRQLTSVTESEPQRPLFPWNFNTKLAITRII